MHQCILLFELKVRIIFILMSQFIQNETSLLILAAHMQIPGALNSHPLFPLSYFLLFSGLIRYDLSWDYIFH